MVKNGRATLKRRHALAESLSWLRLAETALRIRPIIDLGACSQTLFSDLDWQNVSRVTGPREARLWLDISLSEMGMVLGVFSGRNYDPSTVSSWEKFGITQSKINPYKITRKARRAYRDLFRALVLIQYGPGYYLKSRMWRGSWTIQVVKYR